MQPFANGACDPLDAYLNSPVIPTVQDPLVYWHGMTCSNDPIAPMALDFLSTPGQELILYVSFIFDTTISASSTDIERAFRKGRLTVSLLRHSLSDESTRAGTVLGSWAAIPGLVPNQEILNNIQNKQFRWGDDANA